MSVKTNEMIRSTEQRNKLKKRERDKYGLCDGCMHEKHIIAERKNCHTDTFTNEQYIHIYNHNHASRHSANTHTHTQKRVRDTANNNILLVVL